MTHNYTLNAQVPTTILICIVSDWVLVAVDAGVRLQVNMINLMLGDCLERMKEIPDGSVDLTVTSPPYDNLRTYNNSLDWGEHVWKPVLEDLFRVTKKKVV